jgi:hypothetical protein
MWLSVERTDVLFTGKIKRKDGTIDLVLLEKYWYGWRHYYGHVLYRRVRGGGLIDWSRDSYAISLTSDGVIKQVVQYTNRSNAA